MSGGVVQRRWGVIACAGLLAAVNSGCAQRLSAPRSARTRLPSPLPQRQPDRTGERRIPLGWSVEGKLLTLTIFGTGEPAVFVMGGIHGDEPSSAVVARQLIALLRADPDLCAGCTVGILPAANPDGLARHRRTNANRVDLNRNFPARNWQRARRGELSRGDRPGSEPETQAIREAMELLEPACVVSIHAISRGRRCNNYDGPARELAVLMSRHNGYPAKASIGYPTPGSFGSWAGVDQQIPTITLELPKGVSGQQCWEANRGALLALIDAVRSHAGGR